MKKNDEYKWESGFIDDQLKYKVGCGQNTKDKRVGLCVPNSNTTESGFTNT